MHTYIGTKTVKAHPMTRGEYNTYRGWEVPFDENPADDGYLVEYAPDGSQNHEDHEGYISWSPCGTFEASYKLADTWAERLRIEADELNDRIAKLRAFLNSESLQDIPWIERDALDRQCQHMTSYAAVLDERLSRLHVDDPANPEIDAPATETLDDDAEA